jgi:hypothetical protein
MSRFMSRGAAATIRKPLKIPASRCEAMRHEKGAFLMYLIVSILLLFGGAKT